MITVGGFIELSKGDIYVIVENDGIIMWEGYTSEWFGEYNDFSIKNFRIKHDDEDVILYI